jgi:hypothetical protein
VPAAAVIPAPIAYIKVVAVKKLVVECRAWPAGVPHGTTGSRRALLSACDVALGCRVAPGRPFTVKKLECLWQAGALEYISME